jgi:hypothetical protein
MATLVTRVTVVIQDSLVQEVLQEVEDQKVHMEILVQMVEVDYQETRVLEEILFM